MSFKKHLITAVVLLIFCLNILPVNAQSSIEELGTKALELYRDDKYDEAIEYVDKLIEACGENNYDLTAGWMLRSSILASKGNFEESIKSIDKAIYLMAYPDDGIAWYFKANILYAMGDIEEAAECYTKAIQIDTYAEETFGNLETTKGDVKKIWMDSMGDFPAQGELYACESNLKNIATAIEMYATDHECMYPASLDEVVTGNYMRKLPVCPACEKPYIYELIDDGSGYIITCGGENVHLDTGMVAEGYFPMYTSYYGIACSNDSGFCMDFYALSDLIGAGKTAEFMERIEANPDFLNLTDGYSGTLLHLAVTKGNKEITEFLVEKGLDLNATDYDGYTPLHYASSCGFKDIALYLLEKRVSADIRSLYGVTPFLMTSDMEMAELFLDRGADINAVDYDGNNALHRFVSSGNKDFVAYLLGTDIPVDNKNDMGQTPLQIAIYSNCPDIAKLLIDKGASLDFRDDYGSTALHVVSDVELAKLLIEKGVNVKAVNEYGETPLHCVYDNIELARLFLDEGADIDARSESGYTPLDYVVMYGCNDTARFLMEKGADPGNSPLHYAALAGDASKVKELIEDGWDVNVIDGNGETPLHYAFNVEVAELLIKAGADVNAVDYYGSTPLDKAASEELKNFLIENGAEPGSSCGG